MTWRRPGIWQKKVHQLDLLGAALDRRLGFRKIRRDYAAVFGDEPDLENPKGYSEKIQWRKLNDRNPLFPVLTDKLRARDYVRDRLGEDLAGRLLVPLIWAGDNPDQIPFSQLSNGAAIKSAHASGWNHLIRPGEPFDAAEITAICHNWLGRTYGVERHEWAYSQVPPRIAIEKWISRNDGRPARDLKVYCFDGEPFLTWYADKSGDVIQYDNFWPDWTLMEGRYAFPNKRRNAPIEDDERPPYLDELLDVARRLSRGLDTVRVDFLLTEDRFWQGELTLYTVSGLGLFGSYEFECRMGDMWTLPKTNLARHPGAA